MFDIFSDHDAVNPVEDNPFRGLTSNDAYALWLSLDSAMGSWDASHHGIGGDEDTVTGGSHRWDDFLNGIDHFFGQNWAGRDMDGDGDVDANDAALMVQHIADRVAADGRQHPSIQNTLLQQGSRDWAAMFGSLGQALDRVPHNEHGGGPNAP